MTDDVSVPLDAFALICADGTAGTAGPTYPAG